MSMSACQWCDEWVHVAKFGSEVVLASDWKDVVLKYDLKYNDNVVFKFDGRSFSGDLQEQHLYGEVIHLSSPQLAGDPKHG